jgi:hypothetical protein
MTKLTLTVSKVIKYFSKNRLHIQVPLSDSHFLPCEQRWALPLTQLFNSQEQPWSPKIPQKGKWHQMKTLESKEWRKEEMQRIRKKMIKRKKKSDYIHINFNWQTDKVAKRNLRHKHLDTLCPGITRLKQSVLPQSQKHKTVSIRISSAFGRKKNPS